MVLPQYNLNTDPKVRQYSNKHSKHECGKKKQGIRFTFCYVLFVFGMDQCFSSRDFLSFFASDAIYDVVSKITNGPRRG